MSGSLPFCNPLLPSSLPCQAPATNLQLTDILYGTQGQGPQRANQTVQVSLAQVLDLPGSTQYVPFSGTTTAVNLGGALGVGGATTLGGTLAVTGSVSGAGFIPLFAAPPPIGSTTANSGIFTNLTATGTVTLPVPTFPSQPQNTVFAAPSGAAGAPSFRSVVSSDIATALLTPGPIGSTTPNAGAFTTLGAAGTATLGNGSANYLTIAGAASGSNPTITAVGSDANVGLSLIAKNDSQILVQPGLSISNVIGMNTENVFEVFHSGGYTTTVTPAVVWNEHFSGTATSGQVLFNGLVIQADTVNASAVGGAAGFYFSHLFGGSGATGNRTAVSANLQVNGANTQSASSYLVAFDAAASASASAGGTSGTTLGNLFASNMIVGLASGAGTFWNSVIGNEIDVSTPTGTQARIKIGQQIFLTNADAVAGAAGTDVALLMGVAANTTGSPGWNMGIAFSHPESWWGIASTGTMIGTLTPFAGGPSLAAATGIDFSAVSFSTAFLKSTGFLVDGSGNTTIDTLAMTGQTINLPNGTTNIVTTSNNGDLRVAVVNNYVGTSVSASREFSTGTGYSYALDTLHDNNGAPYLQHSVGPSVTEVYYDAPLHVFRNVAATSILSLNTSEITCSTLLGLNSYTVATLPAAPATGSTAYVTDATSPTFLGTLTGGGSVKCPAFYNGTAWVAG